MEAGQLWGLFEDGQLAAFIGVHHEGSMGILEVLPEYRRRGLAMALEGWLIRWHLERGWTPSAMCMRTIRPPTPCRKSWA